MRRYRSRQLFLFLVVLILPTLVIAIQGRWIEDYERERATARSREQWEEKQKRLSAEIGQEVLARLDRIKIGEIANAPSSAIPQPGMYSDPAVALVGQANGQQLIWPWDSDTNDAFRRHNQAPQFVQKIDEAERLEFADKRYDRSADLYRASIELASNDAERAYGRLGLARTLAFSGSQADALRLYREILNLPSEQTDETGLPFASYAAMRLAGFHTADRDVLERVKQDVESPKSLKPIQSDRWRSVLLALQNSSDRSVKEGAGTALERLSQREKAMEETQNLPEAQQLQHDYPNMGVTETIWQPWQIEDGGELWLIGKAPTGAASRPLVIAVRGASVFKSVSVDREFRQLAGAEFHIVSGDAGVPLSERLPHLRISFPSGGEPEPAVGGDTQRRFYVLSFFLVVPLTFLGGYLLWRDTQREVRIAELRSQFVSSVSHELKTPLTSIRMFAEALQMRGWDDPQMHAEYLETIVNESERLSRLLNNVLDFSRIERGQKTYRMEPAFLADVLNAVVRTMQYPLAEQGFVLQLEISDGMPPVKVDRDALQQAVLNLVTNAMKYSGKRRDIELRLCSQNENAVIQVADHGIGISHKEQARIFEKFYRAPIPENRAIAGTGLGLALVAHIAEAHGGCVKVHSSPGNGSTFSIHLPLNGNGMA
jgi:signal transduction histidine kinase